MQERFERHLNFRSFSDFTPRGVGGRLRGDEAALVKNSGSQRDTLEWWRVLGEKITPMAFV